ncbi:MAG: hypothetical protein HY298_14245 [Verrucomicrobia bacterium]|nr:hypothetical protein [Verrucomicrobiota bacterium]
MKTPILKVWQLALLAGGVAVVGVCLKVIGQTTPPVSTPQINAVASGSVLVASTNALALGEAGPNELFPPSTNNPAPPELRISPDLAQVIKLAQAGLGEDVMMAYITNFVHVFDLGSDEIIYLNDLGVPSSVITAMIQQDTSPESAARKLAGNEPSPLPPGLALNSPATNVYPAQQTPIPQPEELPIESAVEAPLTPTYAGTDYAPQPGAVSYFYNSLAPYGNWVNVSGYGLCWQPTVVCLNPTWQPYCDRGRWIYSDCGWYWLSDYSWGWAPFHYGRWVSHANYGWVWSPDCTWGPAWVSWRYSNDYCGWAPLPPEACFAPGVGFTFHNRSVGFGFEFGLRAHHYNFIPFDRFCDYSPSRYRVSPAHVQTVFNQTKFVNKIRIKGNNNNVVINEGIDPAHVAAVTRTEIRKVAIRDTPAPAGRIIKFDHLDREGSKPVVYRPQLPSPSPARPAASGGRARLENRDRATAPNKSVTTRLAISRSDTTVTSRSDLAGSSRGNRTNPRVATPQNLAELTSPSENQRPRVSVTRSSNGLTIRGEPRRAPYTPSTAATADIGQTVNNRSPRGDESARAIGSRNQSQAEPAPRQAQAFAPVRPAPHHAPEPMRVERQQPRSFRDGSSAPQAAPVRPQFNPPGQAPSQPVYAQPARPQFNPAPPAYSQPNQVEHRNNFQARSQFARSEYSPRPAQPAYSPPPSQPSFAPAPQHSQRQEAPRGNSQPASQNSDRGDRKR